MKTTSIYQWLTSLLFVAALSGCTDHRIPVVTPGSDPGRLRVKTITQDQPGNTAKVSSFKYDAQGRLNLIIAYQTPDSTLAPVENSVFQYDAQNRLTQLQRTTVRRGSESELYTYTYNSFGQVAGIGYKNSNPIYTWSVVPQYDASNRVVGNTKSFTVLGVLTNESSAFTFTGNNLRFATTTGQAVQRGFTLPPETITRTFTYDTNVNPFYGVFVIPDPFVFALPPAGGIISYYTYYGGIANMLNLSQNNLLSDGTSTYAYTYNSTNLPTSRITTTGGQVVETLRYEYEAY